MKRLLIFLLALLCLYGVQLHDPLEFALLSSSPLRLLPQPDRQFLHASPLTFFIGYPFTHWLGAETSYAIVNSAGVALFVVSLLRFLARRFGSDAQLAFYILALSPLFVVLLSWFGKSDTYLLAFYFGLAAAEAPWPAALCAALMVLCHRELATLIIASHMLFSRRHAVSIVAGLIAGQLMVAIYLYGLLPSPPNSRMAAAAAYWPQAVVNFLKNPVGHILFTLNWFWFVPLIFAKEGKLQRDVAICLALAFAVAFFSEDYTRVFVLVALPTILHLQARAVHEPGVRAFYPWLPALALIHVHLKGGDFIDSNWLWLLANWPPRFSPG